MSECLDHVVSIPGSCMCISVYIRVHIHIYTYICMCTYYLYACIYDLNYMVYAHTSTKVDNDVGSLFFFLKDVWTRDANLQHLFPRLYQQRNRVSKLGWPKETLVSI